MKPSDLPTNEMVCTGELRFVVRDGQKILQQRWMGRFPKWDTHTGYGYDEIKVEWRDVPIQDEAQ